MRLHRDERGQTIILVALSLPFMLGFIGMATDVGALFKDKRTIQTAADAAAIAGALNLNYGNYSQAAIDAAKANGYTNGSNGVVVDPEDPPKWAHSEYKGATPGYVEVTITKKEPTIFLALFGYPSVTVLARAVATNQASSAGCLYSVGTSGTGFTNNGTVTVNASSCGLVVDSADPTSAMVLNGHSDTVNLGSIGVVGGYTGDGSPTVNPTPVTGVAPESDPLNYLPQYSFTSTSTKGNGKTTTYTVSCASGYDCSDSPITVPANCATTGSSSSGTYNVAPGSTLSPGCYAGLTFPSSGTVTLNPGLYLIAGDLTFGGGNVNGNGVTFYWGSTNGKNGNISFGSGTYDLVAPNDKTALFNGVLLAESITDTNNISFGGNSNTTIDGVVYAPGTSFKMAGTPQIHLNADFVVHDITLSGNVTLSSYDALSGVASPLNSVALVE